MIIRNPVGLAFLAGWAFLILAMAAGVVIAWGTARDPFLVGGGLEIIVAPAIAFLGLELVSIEKSGPYFARYCCLCVVALSVGAFVIQLVAIAI